MTSQSSIFVCAILLSITINVTWGSGVLTIRLTGFKNSFGRTYDGACCDPTPKDHGSTCYDQCDYVMRLIVTGLGRANDHVFLFHRPLTYDSNNIVFTNGDSNLLLTVLFDEWPEDDQVKMNAFFYDYDDFDHTTTLVDWFETDLRHSNHSSIETAETWGHFQQQTVVGNRQTDKTTLTFEWSALKHKGGDYTTLQDSTFTFIPDAEPTQMIRLSTPRETTRLLRQSWSNSQGDSYTDMNLEHNLQKEFPVSVKSAAVKQNVLEYLNQSEKHTADSSTEDTDHIGSLIKNRRNFKSDQSSFKRNGYARRRNELFKGSRAKPKISKAQWHKRKHTKPRRINESNLDSNNHEFNSAKTAYSSLPTDTTPKVDTITQPNNVKQFDDDDNENDVVQFEDDNKENDMNKPPNYNDRQSFERPQSWFNVVSNSQPPTSRHFINGRGKFDSKKLAELKNFDSESLFHLFKEENTSTENTETNQDDANYELLATTTKPHTHYVINGDKQQPQMLKDVEVTKSSGNIFQQTWEHSTNDKNNLHKNELKINLTDMDSTKLSDNVKDIAISNYQMDTTNYHKTKKIFHQVLSSSNADFINVTAPSSTVIYTDFRWNLSSVTFKENVPTRITLPSLRDYKINYLSGLKEQDNYLPISSDSVEPNIKDDHLSKSNKRLHNKGLQENIEPLLQTTVHPPYFRTLTPEKAQSIALTTIDSPADVKNDFQEAQTNPETFRDSDIVASHVSHTDSTHIPHQYGTEKIMAPNTNMANNFPRKSDILRNIHKNTQTRTGVWNEPITTNSSVSNKLDVTTRSTVRSRLENTTSNRIEAHVWPNHSHPLQNHHSKALSSVPRSKTSIYINAAAALDRFHPSPSTQKSLPVQVKQRIDITTQISNDNIVSKEYVARSDAHNKNSSPTQLTIWKPQKEVLYDRLENTAKPDRHVSDISESVSTSTKRPEKISKRVSYLGENSVIDKYSSYKLINGPTEIISKGISDSRMTIAEKTDSIENNVFINNKTVSSEMKEEQTIKHTNSDIQVFNKQTADINNNKHVNDKITYNQSELFNNIDKNTKTLATSHHINTGLDMIEGSNIETNERQWDNSDQSTTHSTKKYRINFTSLPMLLESETESALIQPDVQFYDTAEEEDFELDTIAHPEVHEIMPYIDEMDISTASLSQKRYNHRPETPKPPSSGELMRHSIKALKAVKYQTHAPVEWYVTAQQIQHKVTVNSPTRDKKLREIANSGGLLAKDEVRNHSGRKTNFKNSIYLSDTKLHNDKTHHVPHMANVSRSVVDLFRNNPNVGDKDEQTAIIDPFHRSNARNAAHNQRLTTDSSHEYKSSNLNLQHSLAQLSHIYKNISKNGDTWQLLTEPFKRDKELSPNTIKLNKFTYSNLNDNKLNNNTSNEELIVGSFKNQDSIETLPQSANSSIDKNYKLKLQETLVDLVDQQQKSSLKEYYINRSPTKDHVTTDHKPMHKKVPLTNSFNLNKESFSQTTDDSLMTNQALNRTTNIQSSIGEPLNDNGGSHNNAGLWRPPMESFEKRNKTSIVSHLNLRNTNATYFNSPQFDTNGEDFDDTERNQKEYISVSRHNFVQTEKENIMLLPRENGLNNRQQNTIQNGILLSDNQEMKDTENYSEDIMTDRFFSESKDNLRDTFLDKQSLHNMLFRLEELSTTSKQNSPHKLHSNDTDLRRINTVHSNSAKDLNYLPGNTSFVGEYDKGISKLIPHYQNNVNSKWYTPDLLKNSFVKTLLSNENWENKQLVKDLKDSDNNLKVTNNTETSNITLKNSHVSTHEPISIQVEESNQIVPRLANTKEYIQNQKTIGNKVEQINLEPYISNSKHKSETLKNKHVLGEPDTIVLKSNAATQLYNLQNTNKESYNNRGSKEEIPQFKMYPKMVNSSNVSNKQELNILKRIDYIPFINTHTTSLIPAPEKTNSYRATPIMLNGTLPKKNSQGAEFKGPAAFIEKENNVISNIRKQDNMVSNIWKQDTVVSNTGKQENVVTNAEKQDNLVSKTGRQENTVSNTSKQKNVVNSTGKQELVVSNTSNVVSSSGKQENMIGNKGKKENVVSNTGKQENVVSNKEKKENVVSNKGKQENVVSNKEKKENVVSNIGKQENVVSNKEKKENVVSNIGNQENGASNKEKKENVVSNIGKQENVVSNKEKKENVVSNTGKQENVVSNKEKKENVVSNTGKQENTVGNTGKQVNGVSDTETQKNGVSNTDNVISREVTNRLANDTAKNSRSLVSTNEKKSSRIDRTKIIFSLENGKDSILSQSDPNLLLSEIRLLDKVSDSSDGLKTNYRKDSDTFELDKLSSADTVADMSLHIQGTNKTTGLGNTVNKNAALAKARIDNATSTTSISILPTTKTVPTSKRLSNTNNKPDNTNNQIISQNNQTENTTTQITSHSHLFSRVNLTDTAVAQITSTGNESHQDPFKMMDLFMSRHNFLDATLQTKKQSANLASPQNITTDKKLNSHYSNSSLPQKATTPSDVKTSKSTSKHNRESITKASPTKQTSRINIFDSSAIANSSLSTKTKKLANVYLESQTQKVYDEKDNVYEVTVALKNDTFHKKGPLTNKNLTMSSTASTTDKDKLIELTTQLSSKHVTTKRTTPLPSSITSSKLQPSVAENITESFSTFSLNTTSFSTTKTSPINKTKDERTDNFTRKINMYTAELQTTVSSTQVSRVKSMSTTKSKPIIMRPNFDKDGTKILYSTERLDADEVPTSNTYSPAFIGYHSMNTLPEHGFVLHTPSLHKGKGKPTIQSPNGLPLPKLSRMESNVGRQFIYREMNLDKFRSYVQAIRNHPTVKVPFGGLYTPVPDENSVLRAGEIAELPDPVMRVGSFYTSISNVGNAFTRYWPAVLGVSIGTIFLVTALVTSILCRQRRLLIQRARWSDAPQHVSEPPDTSEYTSSSEASLTSDLTRSSINLM